MAPRQRIEVIPAPTSVSFALSHFEAPKFAARMFRHLLVRGLIPPWMKSPNPLNPGGLGAAFVEAIQSKQN